MRKITEYSAVPHPYYAKPFLKWPGGKGWLAKRVFEYLPPLFRSYHEPFAGASSIMLRLNPANAFLSDLNFELISAYRAIRDCPFEVSEELRRISRFGSSENIFYLMRSHERERFYRKFNDVERAVRFIFLNKTCFNGLYRLNKRGYFNVPFGKYANPGFPETEDIFKASKALQTTSIRVDDFRNCLKYVKEKDFVYLDPPYFDENNTGGFRHYTGGGFSFDDQSDLLRTLDSLNNRGVAFLLSNTPSKSLLRHSRENNYYVYSSIVRRSIAADSAKRGKTEELLVTNYRMKPKKMVSLEISGLTMRELMEDKVLPEVAGVIISEKDFVSLSGAIGEFDLDEAKETLSDNEPITIIGYLQPYEDALSKVNRLESIEGASVRIFDSQGVPVVIEHVR